MKKTLDNIRELFNDENVDNKKTIVFFAFYLVFFAILLGCLFLGGNKEYLHQDYEKGDTTVNAGFLGQNYVFDYKITVDGVLHDYYGKRYENTELFKYNNQEYYRDGSDFFVNQDLWINCDNPYLFYELFDYDHLSNIFMQATFISKKNNENQGEELKELFSKQKIKKLMI